MTLTQKKCQPSGYNLDTAICNEFVCELTDTKCQQELLDIPELTVDIPLQKGAPTEVVSKQTEEIWEVTSAVTSSSDVHKFATTIKYYCCGEPDHHPSVCT